MYIPHKQTTIQFSRKLIYEERNVTCDVVLIHCRKVFNVTLDSLPSYKNNKQVVPCDSCILKGENNQPSVIYCEMCDKKYCTRHEQVRIALLMHITNKILYEVKSSDLRQKQKQYQDYFLCMVSPKSAVRSSCDCM